MKHDRKTRRVANLTAIRAVELSKAGITYEEIAAELGIASGRRAVPYYLHKGRKLLRKRIQKDYYGQTTLTT